MDFFLWGHLKEHGYEVPPRTIKNLVAKIQPAVITVDADVLRRVRQNAVGRDVVCLEMNGDRLENIL
jgi:hypothetical protein